MRSGIEREMQGVAGRAEAAATRWHPPQTGRIPPMDWKSRRVTSLLEAALVEDKVANDITTALTVDSGLRATGIVIAKQPCVVSGLGSIGAFLELFAKLSSRSTGRYQVISHPEIFDGVRVRKDQ